MESKIWDLEAGLWHRGKMLFGILACYTSESELGSCLCFHPSFLLMCSLGGSRCTGSLLIVGETQIEILSPTFGLAQAWRVNQQM